MPEAHKTKETYFDYLDEHSKTETEKINGDIERVSNYNYENDELV